MQPANESLLEMLGSHRHHPTLGSVTHPIRQVTLPNPQQSPPQTGLGTIPRPPDPGRIDHPIRDAPAASISRPAAGTSPATAPTPRTRRPASFDGISLRLLGSPLVYRGRTHKPRGYPAVRSGCPAATHRRDRSLCARDPYGDGLGVRIWCTKSPPLWPEVGTHGNDTGAG